MGGGEKVYQPTPPAAPTTAEAINAYIAGYPKMFALQQEYAPQQAAQQVELAQQYAAPLGQAYQQAQEAMYPGISSLRDTLTEQAQAGMGSEVPDWMRQEYLSNVRAQLGPQAGSPIGADYLSRGLLQQQEDWKRYYQNLGLSLTGQQSLLQPTGTTAPDMMSGYTPQSVMNQMMGGYNTYAQASRPFTVQQPNYLGILGKGLGGLMGGLGYAWGGGQ